jgi:hypothetical protein
MRRYLPGLTAAAVGATTVSTAVMTGATTSFAGLPVELAALVTPANSTAQIFAGTTYYGHDYTQDYGPQQVVPFFLGPQGIVNAIDQNSGGTQRDIAVVASGWGAGQTGTALATMQQSLDPALQNVKLVILDNNTNFAAGGFWTTYWMFAPLLGTSAAPSPTSVPGVQVINTAYEYNINSDAPTYPINILADANSLAAYILDYGAQSSAPLPTAALDPANGGKYYIVKPDGTLEQGSPTTVPDSIVTYVMFESTGLPLVQLLRLIPGGNVIADALEPVLTVLVNSGYQDNNPIPTDPTATRPVGLLPAMAQITQTIQALPGAVQQGVQSVQNDLSSPSSLVTHPLTSTTTATSKINTAAGQPPNALLPTMTNTPQAPPKLDITVGSKFSPGSDATGTTGSSSADGSSSVQRVAGRATSPPGGPPKKQPAHKTSGDKP